MHFLEHYNSELRYLREAGSRFAHEHPQVAAELGIHPTTVTDPFVERLLEGVSFLSARVHARLELEGSEFAQQALQGISPLFMCSTPSMTTFAFHPDFGSPEAFRGRTIRRGTVVSASMVGRKQSVQFVTCSDVRLCPLRLSAAECVRSVVGLPASLAVPLASAQALIRLRFNLEANHTVGDLMPEDAPPPLRLHLAGDLPTMYRLYRALLADTSECWAMLPGAEGESTLQIPIDSLQPTGMSDEDAALPAELGGIPGLRLLREYFAQPTKFLGVELDIVALLAEFRPSARSFDLIFKLRRPAHELLGEIGADNFRLFATPVINLYPRRLDPVPYDANKTQQWMPVDRTRPAAHHLWSILEAHVSFRDGRTVQAHSALESGTYFGTDASARYAIRRQAETPSGGARGDNRDLLASHDEISIALPGDTALLDDLATVLLKGLVADRGWKPQLLSNASLHFSEEVQAVQRIECLWPASTPRAAPGPRACWAAVPHLGSDPLGLRRPGRIDIAARIACFVALAADEASSVDRQRLKSINAAYVSPGFMRAGRSSPMAWVSSRKVELDIAAALHADQGAWLFGRVMAQALAETASLNDGLEISVNLDGEELSSHSNAECHDGVLGR